MNNINWYSVNIPSNIDKHEHVIALLHPGSTPAQFIDFWNAWFGTSVNLDNDAHIIDQPISSPDDLLSGPGKMFVLIPFCPSFFQNDFCPNIYSLVSFDTVNREVKALFKVSEQKKRS